MRLETGEAMVVMSSADQRNLQLLLPPMVPFGWQLVEDFFNVFAHQRLKLQVIVTLTTERDQKRWLHLSASQATRIPTWEELILCKVTFLGPERVAVQVLPKESEYVNINPRVLHLWSCLDGDPVPDFRHGGAI